MPIAVETRIDRYHVWRRRQPVDRPLIGLIWEPDIPPLPQFMESVGVRGELRPDQIDVELFLPHVERWYLQDCELTSDVIQRFTPAFGIPWVEAIAGVLMVWAVFALVRAIHNERAGLIAAAMLALSNFHLYFSRNAYPQCSSVLLLLVAVLCHLHWQRRRRDDCGLFTGHARIRIGVKSRGKNSQSQAKNMNVGAGN